MVSAVRGATTVESDNKELVIDRVCELVDRVFEVHEISDDDAVSISFSITDDITSINPASALRQKGGYAHVPLYCAQEPNSEGMLPLTIRILVTWNNSNGIKPQPIYQHGAKKLRPDLFK